MSGIKLACALFIKLDFRWNSPSSQGAYLILIAILLHVYDSIGDSTMTGIVTLIGLILYFIGLGKLKESVDTQGTTGVSRLKIAVILVIIAVIFGWIPLLASIVSGILLIIAFIFEFLGYGSMKQIASLGQEGQTGVRKLRISMIVLLIRTFINIFPLTGVIVGFISLIALWFIFQG